MPSIVSMCIEDVERRGLDEVGIYRVSASTADVQRIKKAFDKSKYCMEACAVVVMFRRFFL